jgi:hypothetical protein
MFEWDRLNSILRKNIPNDRTFDLSVKFIPRIDDIGDEVSSWYESLLIDGRCSNVICQAP